MGNRAVITTPEKKIGLYLHWNGGRDSVEPMLKYCEMKGYRAPGDSYGWARLAQVAGNFFGGSLSVGIDLYENLDADNWDNGVYIIEGWKIVGREYFDGSEQQEYDFNDMLKEFDKAMPEGEQLGEYLDAQEIPVDSVKLGDMVYKRDIRDNFVAYEVVGFGNGTVNGTKCSGVPYVAIYGRDGDYSWNINNYILGDTCRIKPKY